MPVADVTADGRATKKGFAMNAVTRTVMTGLLVLGATAGIAQAQTKKELVNKVLALQQPGVEAMARQLAERPAIEMSMAARPYLQNVPADKRDGVIKAIDADLKKYADEAIPLLREKAIALSPSILGAELESNFNEAELKQLISWFESPVIKRFNQLVPNMQRSLTEKLVNDTRGQIEPKLKTLEAAMAKQLGVPPAPPGAGGAAGAAPASGAPSAMPPAPMPVPAAPASPAAGVPGMPGNRGTEAPRK